MFDIPVLIPGGRRIARPLTVEACAACGAPVGCNYPDCLACRQKVEALWWADWAALLTEEGITAGTPEEHLLAELVYAEPLRYPWTVVDVAMWQLKCPACGCDLGGGSINCPECETVFGVVDAYDMPAGYQGVMTGNEHAIRVGRWILRYPHRYNEALIRCGRFSFPILLTGAIQQTAQHLQAIYQMVKAGAMPPEARFFTSFTEIYHRFVQGTPGDHV
jgi:hypothetical protein